VNAALLAQLRDRAGEFVGLSELGERLDVVGMDLDELERFGYSLERHPYHGVAYRGPSARLCPDQIEWGLTTRRIGRRVAVWDRVASTNDLAMAAARSPTNEGLVVLAEAQTDGRGRRGRKWVAPHGTSLLMSALLFPTGPLAQPSWLMALGAVAVADLCSEIVGREVRIKWPNDVRIDGRKIAGVLIERGPGAVIGIGLNVNFTLGDLPEVLRSTAASLGMFTDTALDRSDLAKRLIVHLDRLYDEGICSGPDRLARAWHARLEPLGRDVVLATPQGSVRGRLIDADLISGLTVEKEDGTLLVVPPETVLDLGLED
jgi:BirA family biotin operon repressor/biotin-[acetyl-CoA-carboxylase] ligase